MLDGRVRVWDPGGEQPQVRELIFCCCHNNHEQGVLKGQKLILSQFCRLEVRIRM